jgi:lipoprotein NlpD
MPSVSEEDGGIPASVKVWKWPAQGEVIQSFSAMEKGLSIAGKEAQPIYAAATGSVVYRGSGLIGLGELVIIKHDKSFLSAYAHNKKILVKEGDRVVLGQPIAEMGKTGTDRVKLYFEIRKDGKPVNPLLYLPRKN